MHISAWNVALQTINFVVLAWLLNRFLFKPVRAVLAKRQTAIEASMREADGKKAESERVIEEYRAKSTGIASEAERARQQALATAENEARRIREDAARQARAEVERGKSEMGRERVEVLHALEERAAALATSIASRLLGEALPDDALFLWRATASIDALEPARRAALRSQLAGRVEVMSSRPLEPATRERFDDWLASLAGKPVAASFGTDESLIAGVELRLPTGVWRSNWRASLERIRAELEGHAAAA